MIYGIFLYTRQSTRLLTKLSLVRVQLGEPHETDIQSDIRFLLFEFSCYIVFDDTFALWYNYPIMGFDLIMRDVSSDIQTMWTV